jgi:MFS family permease
MRSSRNIVAWEGWRKRRQRAGKGRAIGIGGVSSAGDNLGAEASRLLDCARLLFVGATTLLTTTYRPAERGKAQAFNDFMVFGTTTTASLMASVVLELKGWEVLNYFAFGLICVALFVIGLFRSRNAAPA